MENMLDNIHVEIHSRSRDMHIHTRKLTIDMINYLSNCIYSYFQCIYVCKICEFFGKGEF